MEATGQQFINNKASRFISVCVYIFFNALSQIVFGFRRSCQDFKYIYYLILYLVYGETELIKSE